MPVPWTPASTAMSTPASSLTSSGAMVRSGEWGVCRVPVPAAAWGGQVGAQRRLFPGLIHKATVKVVNVEHSCVTVEWSEGGATKGKEVSDSCLWPLLPRALQRSRAPAGCAPGSPRLGRSGAALLPRWMRSARPALLQLALCSPCFIRSESNARDVPR